MTQPDKKRNDGGSNVLFGVFQFFPTRRQLLESGSPVKLGTRALDLLAILVEKAGQTVSKEELLSRVWPTTVVEEINLRVHVAALRRALGDGQRGNRFIVNVAGRGYAFVAALSFAVEAPAAAASKPQTSRHNLPNALSRMVGREAEVRELTRLVRTHRLLTVVGAGGVGKTSIALAVARNLLESFPDGVLFVDLAAVRDGAAILDAFGAALGLSVSKEDPSRDLVDFVKDKNLLLVVDNCEQVIAEIARTTEQLLKTSIDVRVLATSREPLHAEGEWRYRMTPLEVPEEGSTPISALEAREHSSVELFVERAMTGEQAFELTDTNAAMVAAICRALDGLPLAIELAAAGVGRLGIRELAVRVHDQVSRGTSGRRTAAMRHQTLQATFDWSFELLSPVEKLAFQRLAVFNGVFTMESAAGVIAHAGVSNDEAVNAMMGLAEKSLIVTDITGTMLRSRFLNTIRAYAFDKLRSSPDFIFIQRWHAEQVLKLMRQAELRWNTMERAEWIATYEHAIDDVRAALDWAFSAEGDAALGTALTSTSVPFGLQLGRLEEFRARVEHALCWFTTGGSPQPEIQSRLRETLAQLTGNLQRMQPNTTAESAAAPDAVEGIELPKNRITPLLRKTVFQIESGDYEGALKTAARMAVVAQKADDPLAVLTANRVAAQAHHFAGNHAIARAYAERVLDHPAKSIPVAYVPVQTDRRVWMRILLGRTFWMEGQAEHAVQVTAEALELATADSPFALCQVLAFAACPISIWNGDVEQAQHHVRTLMAETRRYRLDNWRAYGEWYERVLDAGLNCDEFDFERPVETVDAPSIGGLLLDTIVTMNPRITGTDPLSLSATGWSAPEMLRVQGEFILRQGAADSCTRAEGIFLQALELSETQRALAWKLRAAISLSRLWFGQKSPERGKKLLKDVCSRFPVGCSTPDLRRARSLLEDLA